MVLLSSGRAIASLGINLEFWVSVTLILMNNVGLPLDWVAAVHFAVSSINTNATRKI